MGIYRDEQRQIDVHWRKNAHKERSRREVADLYGL